MTSIATLPYQLEIIADRISFDERIEHGEGSAQHKPKMLAYALLTRHPRLGDRVCMEIVEEVLDQWPSCLEALDAAATQFLEIHHGHAHLQGVSHLRQARSLFDEDLLLAAWCAGFESGATSDYRPLDAWKLVPDPLPLAIPADLAEVLERPLAETHLHLAGTAPPITFWLPLMLSLLSVEQAANMIARGTSEETGEARRLQDVKAIWLRRLVEAAVLRCWIAAVLPLPEWTTDYEHPFRLVLGLQGSEGRPRIPPAGSPLETWVAAFRQIFDRIGHARPEKGQGPALPGCAVWVDPLGRFPFRDCLTQAVEVHLGIEQPLETAALGERYLLASALRLLRGIDEERSTPARLELRRNLLRYIRIKHSFLRLLVYSPGIPGLERFQLRLRRGRAKLRYDRARRIRQIWDLAAVRSQTRLTVLRWLAATTQAPLLKSGHVVDPDLRRTEGFLQAGASRLERRLELRISPGEGPRHGRLIRAVAQGVREALETLEGSGSPQGLPALQVGLVIHLHKLPELDQEAGAEIVQRMLDWLHEHPAWRPFVVGIDVAGSELDGPPSRFALAYRRLREGLESGTASDPLVHINLGKTFHVGEDFRDLLTGIRQVNLAVDLLGLTAGDRLGHALAIGHDPGAWYRRHGSSFPRLGDHILDLFWARDLLLREPGSNEEGRALATVEERLARLNVKRFEDAASNFRAWLDDLRAPDGGSSPLYEEDLQQQLVDKVGAEGQAIRLTRVDADDAWIDLLTRLQGSIIRRLEREGIVVEANPTSNLLISGLEDFSDLPLFRLHPVAPPSAGVSHPLRLSISTDDPEVFRVHLREEYSALLAAGLAGGRHSRRDLLEWLDRLRQDGFDTSFLKRSSPRGAELAGYLQSLVEPE